MTTKAGNPVTADDRSEDHDSQDAIFAFLADPVTHGGMPVRRIDTHSAAVFLAGDRAFKVKRAVRYPFLDFFLRSRLLADGFSCRCGPQSAPT